MTKYNPIPAEIIVRTDMEASGKGESNVGEGAIGEASVRNDIIESYDPRFSLDQVILNASVKEKINTAISATRHRAFLCDNWGLAEHFGSERAVILNFYGKPGTGKSMAAEAVASALGKKVYRINNSDLESKYVGAGDGI